MRPEIAVLAALVAVALLSMAAFRWGPARGRPDRDAAARGGTFFLGLFVRDWFYWFVRPLERAALALRLAPDVFNVVGLLLGLASMLLFWHGRLVWAGWALLAGGVADILDGRIARARGIASRYGTFIDSTLDRFSEFAAFVGIAAFYGSGVPVLLTLVALGGSLLVSYTRARGESVGVLCKEGFMQRAERMLLLGFGAILDPALSAAAGRARGAALFWIVAAIAAGSVGTSIYRTIWIARRLRAEPGEPRAGGGKA